LYSPTLIPLRPSPPKARKCRSGRHLLVSSLAISTIKSRLTGHDRLETAVSEIRQAVVPAEPYRLDRRPPRPAGPWRASLDLSRILSSLTTARRHQGHVQGAEASASTAVGVAPDPTGCGASRTNCEASISARACYIDGLTGTGPGGAVSFHRLPGPCAITAAIPRVGLREYRRR